jgi:hypothetical protein
MALKQGFLPRFFGFPLRIIIPPLLHTHPLHHLPEVFVSNNLGANYWVLSASDLYSVFQNKLYILKEYTNLHRGHTQRFELS